MNKVFSTLIVFLFAVFILSGCSKNSDTTITPNYNGNRNPYTPANPNPSNGQTNVSGFVTATWTGGDPDLSDTVRYDVKAGTTSPPTTVILSNTLNPSVDIGIGAPDTFFYWQVIAKDNHSGVTTGPVWSYKTAP